MVSKRSVISPNRIFIYKMTLNSDSKLNFPDNILSANLKIS